MFWEVWRNVTSATTSWSLGGSSGTSGGGGGGGAKKGLPSSSSSSAHKTRYNRLNGRPTKSQSQPANLTSLQCYSSSESLTGCGTKDDEENDKHLPTRLSLVKEGRENGEGGAIGGGGVQGQDFTDLFEGSSDSHFAPSCDNVGNLRKSKKNGMKHSFSSFFPFTSCATTASASSPPPPSSSTNVTSVTSTSSTNGNGDITGKFDILDHSSSGDIGAGASSMTNGNGASCWDHQVKKEMGNGVYDEEEISDLDDEVEHLTCDVCERAFPTLKLLARHQRKKRHYGCLQCDSIFPSREVLECHREQMCHYDYAIDVYDEDEDEENFFESDDDEHGIRECEEDCDDEERERLL